MRRSLAEKQRETMSRLIFSQVLLLIEAVVIVALYQVSSDFECRQTDLFVLCRGIRLGMVLGLCLAADSVEKQAFAGAEYRRLNVARAPFLSGVSRLLRCRKDLCQFAEVLG
ncbi:MAG: hypothetical protein JJ869_20475, partial [Marivita sp.]|nr:hypothetical protein [Marivita sp.]